MRKLGAVFVIVLSFLAFAPVGVAGAAPIVEQDVVASLNIADPDAPVGVAFGRHAAIYRLARDDPNFAPWLALLQRSLKNGTAVRFSYDVVGPRLTIVESAQ
ncbi:hypothetical protein [Mycobacterium montefiorense]|uniref:hypothetical protein n=1 Tax=Mycobacterium montefiorense TaxID=154654 RepID=UPI0021F29440|nr:hypothetical protein [Mycobacterium montefiorense]MCV7429721.1 hypothetical protein [Mycobacterium montefiorense]GLE51105.1 hypothetical protein ATCCBAA256_06940 [Mycobacterium montefiorense]